VTAEAEYGQRRDATRVRACPSHPGPPQAFQPESLSETHAAEEEEEGSSTFHHHNFSMDH